ncbi:CDP-alcohol phosphatidyltransferase family protein [Shinella zoogloeoides]|uniref:CDP-alcohol phosphatidyltransferase family protein n=1 Tax=Shinella zoogloeoides TaxID=352475 RepID=UPI00273FDC36|nr:CDP-alcohol phosphatidyltransferase family protein [Shinella zoogloeoides]WLR91327.1 CDP-alcohol phosphatidyltransferase family protein [Shinella zoogloeoides]
MTSAVALAAQIIAEYRGSKKQEFDSDYVFFPVYRWSSFYPTALCIKAGLTANQVTSIGCAMLLAGVFALYSGWLMTGALLYLAAYVIDFIDGNIARFTKSFSAFGKMIDGLVDSLTFLIFFALAHGMSVSGQGFFDPSVDVLIGVIVSFVFLFRCYVQIRLTFVRGSLESTAEQPAASSGRSSRFKFAKRGLLAIVSGMPLFLILAVLLNLGSLYNLLYALFFGFLTVVELIHGLRILYKQ